MPANTLSLRPQPQLEARAGKTRESKRKKFVVVAYRRGDRYAVRSGKQRSFFCGKNGQVELEKEDSMTRGF